MRIAPGLCDGYSSGGPAPLSVRMHVGNMLDVLKLRLGRFDIATPFCHCTTGAGWRWPQSVRKAAELAPIMVLQAKTDTEAMRGEQSGRVSSTVLETASRKQWFPHVEVFAPKGFTPTAVGRKGARAPGTSAASIPEPSS